MRSYRKLVALAACLGLLAGGTFLAPADDKAKPEQKEKKEKGEPKKPKESKEKGKKDNKKGAPSEEEKGKLSIPILKGHDAFGLKIPYFDADGKIQMIFNIGRASRIDDNRVNMSEMVLETFDDEGGTEMSIDLPSSVLDLTTNVITTESTATIKRSDFELTGRSMEFNTKTRQGKLAGDVRMLIYDIKGEVTPATEEKTNDTP
jgi:hypothetical protein